MSPTTPSGAGGTGVGASCRDHLAHVVGRQREDHPAEAERAEALHAPPAIPRSCSTSSTRHAPLDDHRPLHPLAAPGRLDLGDEVDDVEDPVDDEPDAAVADDRDLHPAPLLGRVHEIRLAALPPPLLKQIRHAQDRQDPPAVLEHLPRARALDRAQRELLEPRDRADGQDRAAVEFASRKLQNRGWLGTTATLALAVFLIFGSLRISTSYFTEPKYFEHIRPSLHTLQEGWRTEDALYVSNGAVPAFEFYAPLYGLTQTNYVSNSREDYQKPERISQQLESLKGNSRVWVLMSHVYEKGDFNEKDFILDALKQEGRMKREFRVPGTSVYLYLFDLQE